jgi:hypothetical protein
MAPTTLEHRLLDVVRESGRAEAPIQAWPLMRRLGQLSPEMQALAFTQISSLLDTFEALDARISASKTTAGRQSQNARMSWDPTAN